MKKSILFALSVLTALSLTACQNQAETAEETQENVSETVQESAETTANEEPDSIQADAEKTEEAVNFDNSWASNDYEKQIPELPFENWRTGTAHDENTYLIIAEDLLYTNVKEYGERLMENAFPKDIWLNDESEGLGYRITAENKRGYSIDYDFNAYSDEEPITGMLTIEIKKLEEKVPDTSSETGSVSWGNPSADAAFPSLPEAEWSYRSFSDTYSDAFGADCFTLTEEEGKAYAETLKAAGFTYEINEQSDVPEEIYHFEAQNESGDAMIQLRISTTLNEEVLLTECWATLYKN